MLVVQCNVSFCREDTFVSLFHQSLIHSHCHQSVGHWFMSISLTSRSLILCIQFVPQLVLQFVARNLQAISTLSPSPPSLFFSGFHFAAREFSLRIATFSYSFLYLLQSPHTHIFSSTVSWPCCWLPSESTLWSLFYITTGSEVTYFIWWCIHATLMILLTTASWQ